jgi:hypothetical protein
MTLTQTQATPTSQKRSAPLFESGDACELAQTKRPRKINANGDLETEAGHLLHSGIKPSGNLLFDPRASIRNSGLGQLDVLSDPFVLSIISLLAAKDVLYLGSCSKALFAYCAHQPIWKDLFMRTSDGKLADWAGTWRKTYLQQFRPTGLPDMDHYMRYSFETPIIDCTGLFSDELYQPYLCANTDVKRYFYPPSRHNERVSASRFNMIRIEAAATEDMLERNPQLASEPFIVSGALEHLGWAAFSDVNEQGASTPRWTLQNLLRRYSDISFRAEAFDCSLQTYCKYAENCSEEDAPLYLFDSRFVEKTARDEDPGMGADYAPPSFLKEDLFRLMGAKRPDYRWLVCSPQLLRSNY